MGRSGCTLFVILLLSFSAQAQRLSIADVFSFLDQHADTVQQSLKEGGWKRESYGVALVNEVTHHVRTFTNGRQRLLVYRLYDPAVVRVSFKVGKTLDQDQLDAELRALGFRDPTPGGADTTWVHERHPITALTWDGKGLWVSFAFELVLPPDP